jgi:hypothetical protein
MATQQIDLSNCNLQTLQEFFAAEQADPKITIPAKKEQKLIVPDEFEIRRKLFFGL